MRRLFRWFFALFFVALAASAIFAAVNFEKLLESYAPFDLREEPNWLTNVQLYYLRTSPEKCFAVLQRSGVSFNRQQYPPNERGCGFDDGVLLTKQTVSYGGGVLLRCAAASGDDFPDIDKAARAKIFAAETANKVTNDALQFYGSSGYGRHNPMERHVRDARMFTIAGGTAQILRTQVASRLLEMKLPQTRDGYLQTAR